MNRKIEIQSKNSISVQIEKNTKMKILNRTLMIKLLLLLSFTLIIQSYTESGELYSEKLKEASWKFAQKDTLCLETLGSTKVFISGSNSGEIEIKLRYIAKQDEQFELNENQTSVILKENILNYDSHRPTQTYFEEWTWIINVPDGTYIKCNGSSGDFEVTDFNGFFKAEYGLGRFIFSNVCGNIDLSLALLHAQIHNSEGSFRLGSAGGSIRATGLTITGNSSFSSGMGSVKISLARAPEADLYVGSNFNKALVSFNGRPVTGYFEFIAMADKGRIISPFKFDKEETFQDDIKNYRDSSDFGKKSDYNRKSFIRGDNKPKITLKTVTGRAQLIK
jgi:hypothetical protein